MPTVRDKPVVHEEPRTKTRERPIPAPPAEKGEEPRWPKLYMRWLGWFAALLMVALAVAIAIVMTSGRSAPDLGGTLEQRFAKDAIAEQQMTGVPPADGVESVVVAVIRDDQLKQKEAIEASNALDPGPGTALETRLVKEAIEASNALRPGLGAVVETRLFKEAIEDGR